MPIEIKELHIKASVVERKGDAGAQQQQQQLSAYELEKIKSELIRVCVQEVLQVLEDKKER